MDEDTLSHFMINKQSAVPLHIQLKEQVRYAIMSGRFEPGSALPSIREMTAQLGVHRNTVHRVYLELQAGGLLVSRPGKGVFVADSLAERVSPREVGAVDKLIEAYFEQGNGLGVNPITLAKLVGQRAPSFDARHPIVAFVECTAHQSKEVAGDLAETFGVNVHHHLLDTLRRSPEALEPHVRHVVTSIFHYDEVRELLGGSRTRVYPVTYDLHPETRKLLREIRPDCRLGFICHDANTEEVVGAQIRERVPPGVLIGCANLETPDHALELIGQVDTVILTEPASAFCVKHCTPDHELLELHFALNAASVEAIGRTLLFQP
ncbi:MAG: GntR family transcriptional regulator [Candidatus Lambdaproteobacteria bacterium]|nr:GntR family transcriptional regulator [Candidatus Lambdaproteobacteria bacterium]